MGELQRRMKWSMRVLASSYVVLRTWGTLFVVLAVVFNLRRFRIELLCSGCFCLSWVVSLDFIELQQGSFGFRRAFDILKSKYIFDTRLP